MMEEILLAAIQANQRKQIWRHHRLPGYISPDEPNQGDSRIPLGLTKAEKTDGEKIVSSA
ncbi:unnamed protein product [Protopolystoma xenopodis]|uniref:Uncharacterized protein n=1 Tax=Protopolystoma xenopodis TaxID=117903 RepID=A0A448X5E5_9PLAT|nr:unnamed protein product [Protopolystoma xenopodis]